MINSNIQLDSATSVSIDRKNSNNVLNTNFASYAKILQETKEQAKSVIEEYTERLHNKTQSDLNNNEPEDFWTLRHKRLKKMLEMQQEMFDHIYELKQLSNHKAEIKSAQMKAEGLIDTSNPMPVITGVPAKYLLSMLTADT